MAEILSAASSGASARAALQIELEAAQREAARLSDCLLTEKARVVEAQHSWAETERSLESRILQLSTQVEASKVRLSLSCISFERQTWYITPEHASAASLRLKFADLFPHAGIVPKRPHSEPQLRHWHSQMHIPQQSSCAFPSLTSLTLLLPPPSSISEFIRSLNMLQAALSRGEIDQAEFRADLSKRVESLGSQLEATHAALQQKSRDLDACQVDLATMKVIVTFISAQ